jgi:hypothetical protein
MPSSTVMAGLDPAIYFQDGCGVLDARVKPVNPGHDDFYPGFSVAY